MKSIHIYHHILFFLSWMTAMLPSVRGEGAMGYALSFDTTNGSYVSVPSLGSLSETFTVEMWVKLDALSPTVGLIGSQTPSPNGFSLKYLSSQVLRMEIGNGSASITASADAPTTLQTNVWYHLACVVTTNGYSIYRDGVQLVTNSFPASTPLLFDANHILNLGRSHQSENLSGAMDEVRIWNVARSGAEILADKNRHLNGDEPGLVQYYRFDEGGGSTIGDSAPAGGVSTGNLVHSPVFVASDIPGFTSGPATAPTVKTLGVGEIAGSSLQFLGTVNASGTNTVVWFEWGKTTNYGNITPEQSGGNGFINVPFNATITNLIAGTTYHFRAVASNTLGVATGDNMTFPVSLKFERQDTNVLLSWPVTTPAFLLEQSTDLSSVTWTTLYDAIILNGTYVVTQRLTNATAFYRLRRMVHGPITPVVETKTEAILLGAVPICPMDANNGCLLPWALDAEFNHAFDASKIVDPNRRPNDPPPAFHWEIYYPPVENGGVKYASAGISGYFAPVLTFQPNSLPQLTAPSSTPDGQWRIKLFITHRSTDPFYSRPQTTVLPFRFQYINSQVDLVMSAICQDPQSPPGECTIDAARYTTEPN